MTPQNMGEVATKSNKAIPGLVVPLGPIPRLEQFMSFLSAQALLFSFQFHFPPDHLRGQGYPFPWCMRPVTTLLLRIETVAFRQDHFPIQFIMQHQERAIQSRSRKKLVEKAATSNEMLIYFFYGKVNFYKTSNADRRAPARTVFLSLSTWLFHLCGP